MYRSELVIYFVRFLDDKRTTQFAFVIVWPLKNQYFIQKHRTQNKDLSTHELDWFEYWLNRLIPPNSKTDFLMSPWLKIATIFVWSFRRAISRPFSPSLVRALMSISLLSASFKDNDTISGLSGLALGIWICWCKLLWNGVLYQANVIYILCKYLSGFLLAIKNEFYGK